MPTAAFENFELDVDLTLREPSSIFTATSDIKFNLSSPFLPLTFIQSLSFIRISTEFRYQLKGTNAQWDAYTKDDYFVKENFAFAYDKLKDIDQTKHHLLVSSHPSPFSARRTFKHFPAFLNSTFLSNK